jgi:hypothetical protein
MSGTIRVDADRQWHAAGWAYRLVLDAIGTQLSGDPEAEQLCRYLQDEAAPALIFEYWDLAELSLAHRRMVATACTQAYQQMKKEGPVDWLKPEVFPDFMQLFAQLCQMLEQ